MAQTNFEIDTFDTSAGELKIGFIGHGTLMLDHNGLIIHIDPVGREADYTQLPKADLILVTHEHQDHLDPQTVDMLRTDNTEIITTATCAPKIPGCTVMKNGDAQTVKGLKIEAVPAYNIVHMRGEGMPFHPKGVGNGYVVTFGDKRVYLAGDTENIPEMKTLKSIDIAFLPMNLPYTMTPEMAADAARTLMPKTLYPYHYGDTDTGKLVDLLKDLKEIDVRIRQLQ